MEKAERMETISNVGRCCWLMDLTRAAARAKNKEAMATHSIPEYHIVLYWL